MAGLFAAVQFTARGGRVERLLDWCVAQGVPVQRICPNAEGFTAWLPARYYRRLHCPARRYGVQIRVNRKRGLWFFLARWRARWGLLAGPLAFLLVLHLAGGIIWSVQYNVPGPMLKKQLEAQLFSQNLQPGAAPTQADLQAAEQALLKQCPELGWITLNFADGRLTVECDRSRDTPIQPAGAKRIAAGESGRLLALNVQSGIAVKRVGQTVTAGETLIEGEKLDRDGRAVPGEAAGSAMALVQKQFRCDQPLTVAAEFPTGRLRRSEAVEGLGQRLDLPWYTQQEPDSRWQKKTTREPLSLFGFALPAVSVRTLWVEYDRQEIRLTQEQAAALAAWACRRQLRQEHPDAELRTEEKEQRLNNDVLQYVWTVQFEADIAVPEA